MSSYTMYPAQQVYRDQQGFEHTYDTRELAYHGPIADLAGLACACEKRTVGPAVPVGISALGEGDRGTLGGAMTDLLLLTGVTAILGAGVWFFAIRK